MIHTVLNIVVFMLGCWGSISLIQKLRIGFLVFLIQNILWGILSFMDNSYGAAAVCIFMAILDIWGYIKWSTGQ